MLDVDDGIGWSHNRYRGMRGETTVEGEPSPSALSVSPELDALITPAAAALPTVDLDQVGLIGAALLFTLASLSPVFICLSFSSIFPTLFPMRCEGVHRRVAVAESMPAVPVPPAPPPGPVVAPEALPPLANAIVLDMDCVLASTRSWYPNVPELEARGGAAVGSDRSILRGTTLGLKYCSSTSR